MAAATDISISSINNAIFSADNSASSMDNPFSKVDSPSPIELVESKIDCDFSNNPIELKIDTTSAQPFILITSLYNETDVARAQEYLTCLEKNLIHPSIQSIHVVYDTSRDDLNNYVLNYLKLKNVKITYIVGRPTFGYLFKLINEQYPQNKIIISNADIYFNETLHVLDSYDLQEKFLALTRWNVKADGSIEIFKQYDKNNNFRQDWSYYSQDTWIFQAPLKPFRYEGIELGTFLCDGIVAFQAYQVKLHVFNPCWTIQCCHLHLSNIRNYQKMPPIQSEIMPVPWTTLYEQINKNENYFEKYQLKECDYQYFKRN